MTPEQLKVSILFAALQGKLVEQKDDESAPDLSRVKIKKTEEIGFDIPNTWKTAHLESISDQIASKQYQISAAEFKTEGTFPIVSQSKEYIIGYCNDVTKLYHHDKPVVVFGDHTTIVKYVDFDFVVGADGVKIFEPNTDIITAKFFSYVLNYYSVGLEKVGGYSRHYKFVKDKPFPIPPLEEQHRIVAKIEELLLYVDRYAESYEKLERFNAKFPEDMKKSILQYAIQGKLVEQRPEEGTAEELYQKIQEEKQKLIKEGKIKKDKPLAEITEDEIPFDIPESWKWERLGNIVSKITDGSHNPPPNTGKGYPVISAKNVKNGEITFENVDRYTDREGFEKENPRTNITRGDVIMGIIGGSIGNIAIYNHDAEVIAQRSIAIIRAMFINEYLVVLLQSPYIQNYMRSTASGSAQGGIYLGTIKDFVVPLPPLAEQIRIVEKIKELMPYCDQLAKK